MTTEEKYYSAKMALKMIAAVEPKQQWVEPHYNNGYSEPCSQCTKMLQTAKIALKELEENNKDV